MKPELPASETLHNLMTEHGNGILTFEQICTGSNGCFSNFRKGAARLLQIFGLRSKDKEAARLLLATFGLRHFEEISNSLKDLPGYKASYERLYRKKSAFFDECRLEYLKDLIKHTPFAIREGTLLYTKKKNDACDAVHTVMLAFRVFLDLHEMPLFTALKFDLHKITLVNDKTLEIGIFLKEMQERHCADIGFFYALCGQNPGEPKQIPRAELIRREITCHMRTLLPNKNLIAFLKEWGKKERTQEVAGRVLNLLCLAPVIDREMNRENRPEILNFNRAGIVLEEKETLAFYVACCTIQEAFEKILSVPAGPFVEEYAGICTEVKMQEKLATAIRFITENYPVNMAPMANVGEHAQLQEQLRQTKEKVDEIFLPAQLPAYHFAFSLLLLAHLARLVELTPEQKKMGLQAIYAMTDQEHVSLLCHCLETLYEWPQQEVAEIDVEGIVKRYGLTSSEMAFLLMRYASYRNRLRPWSPDASYAFLNFFQLQGFIARQEALFKRDLTRDEVFPLLYQQFVTPEVDFICTVLFGSLVEGQGRSAVQKLLSVLRAYPPLLNPRHYTIPLELLRRRKEEADALFSKEERATSAYRTVISALLLIHLSQMVPLTDDKKQHWFEQFIEWHESALEVLYRACLDHEVLQEQEVKKVDMKAFLARYPELTPEQRAILMVRYACYTLRLHPRKPPDVQEDPNWSYVDFSRHVKFIEQLEEWTNRRLPYHIVFKLLGGQYLPRCGEIFCSEWSTSVTQLRGYERQNPLPANIVNRLERLVLSVKGLGQDIARRDPGKHTESAAEVLEWIGNLLDIAVLPYRGHKVYLPFLNLLLPESPSPNNNPKEQKRRHRAVARSDALIEMQTGHRATLVSGKWVKEGFCLTVRLVDSVELLNTRTFRATLPISKDQLDPLLSRALIAFSGVFCKESGPITEQQQPSILNKNPGALQFLTRLKLGFRTASLGLLKSICEVNYKAGNVWRCHDGFALVPMPPASSVADTSHSISFADYWNEIMPLFNHYRSGQTLQLPCCIGITVQGVVVYVTLSSCPENYYTIVLSSLDHPDISVGDKLFKKMTEEQFCMRVCWLLTLWLSDWYALKNAPGERPAKEK